MNHQQLFETIDRLADELFPCSCEICAEQRQARLSRDLEVKYGCSTEYMLMRRKLAAD